MIALRKLDQFDPHTSFIAWMSQIVRFVALNHARRRTTQKTVSLDGAAPSQAVDSGDDTRPALITGWGDLAEDDDRSFDDHVLNALQRLDPTARACLLLRVVCEQPYRQIAQTLDIPEGTAMSHVHRARRAMAAQLAGTHGAAS